MQHVNEHIARGDATPQWEYFFEVRTAELHLVAAAAGDGARARAHVRQAGHHVMCAERVLADTGLGRDALSVVALLKVKLRAALLLREDDHACTLMRGIGARGWPLTRTPLALARPGGPLPPLTPNLRRFVDELLELSEASQYA